METRCFHKKLEFQRYPPKYFCTARYEHKSSKKKPIACHRRGIENKILSPVSYTSALKMCLYQKPARHPPRITGRFVNTVSIGWVGARNERAPFRFHAADVDFVYRCLSRTRNLAASNKHLAEFIQADLGPKSAHGNYVSGFLKSHDLCSKRAVQKSFGGHL